MNPINIMRMAGRGYTFTLAGGNYIDDGSGSNSQVGISLANDGTLTITRLWSPGNTNPTNEYMRPINATYGATLYVRVNLTSGSWTTTAGTNNTWLSLATTKAWTLARTTAGTASVVFTLAIATDAAGSNIVASASYSLDATK